MASVEHLWKSPPSGVALTGNDVHVWSVELDQPPSRSDEMLNMLSQEEQTRAKQFKHDEKRRHFIVGRATLRRLLGECLKVEPATLAFDYTPRGKPELTGALAGKLHFNVSHSSSLALIALTRVCPVGVDVERVRPRQYDMDIARRFFTARESTGLESLPEAERPSAFFNLWTRKEAWLKAMGTGIAEHLNRVELSFLPCEPPRVLSVANDPGEADKWTLVDLKPANGFNGALAIRAGGVNISCWKFRG